MWIQMVDRAVSVVQHPTDAALMQIRGRLKSDVEGLGAPVQSSPERDYAYRVIVSKARWLEILAAWGAGVAYTNFKDAVHQKKGRNAAARGAAYWHVYEAIQRYLSDGSQSLVRRRDVDFREGLL